MGLLFLFRNIFDKVEFGKDYKNRGKIERIRISFGINFLKCDLSQRDGITFRKDTSL